MYDSFAQCQNLKICKFQRVRRVHNMICNSNWNNFTSYSSYFKWSNSFFKAKITFFPFYQKSFEMFYVTKNVKIYFLIFKKWLSYGRLDCNVFHYFFYEHWKVQFSIFSYFKVCEKLYQKSMRWKLTFISLLLVWPYFYFFMFILWVCNITCKCNNCFFE